MEGTKLLAVNADKDSGEDSLDENVILPDTQVPTAENVYNLQRRGNQQPDYSHRYGFQATIVHCVIIQLSMKRVLKKFKQAVKNAVASKLTQLHKRNAFRPVRI